MVLQHVSFDLDLATTDGLATCVVLEHVQDDLDGLGTCVLETHLPTRGDTSLARHILREEEMQDTCSEKRR